MSSQQDTSWIRNFRSQAVVRSAIVLHGNVRDLHYLEDRDEYLPLSDLVQSLLDARDERVFRWSPSDGRLGDIIRDIRHHLGSDQSGLVVLDLAHLALPSHPSEEERTVLARLANALGESAQRMTEAQLDANRCLLVLITSALSAIPGWLMHGDPGVGILEVPTPNRTERLDFFRRHAPHMRAVPSRTAKSEPLREALAREFADHTDGLSTCELRGLVVLSRKSGSPDPTPIPTLMRRFRHGDSESPWEEVDSERIRKADELLDERVKGQPHATRSVRSMLIRAHLGLAGLQHSALPSRPRGVQFFVGPTGVGKTELAKGIAELLFRDESACVRFDMSEYQQEHSDQRLLGAPPGYVGHEAGGQLTNAVKQRPFCVLLFDEIEKAHPRILDKFLQVLDDGRLTDGRGDTVWFTDTIIIFTSNIGAADMPSVNTDDKAIRTHFEEAVRRHFTAELKRPELLNRLGDSIVPFVPIRDVAVQTAILTRKLAPLRQHLSDRFGCRLSVDAEVLETCIQAARPEHGGRGLINALERNVVDVLAETALNFQHQLTSRRQVRLFVMDGVVKSRVEDSH